MSERSPEEIAAECVGRDQPGALTTYSAITKRVEAAIRAEREARDYALEREADAQEDRGIAELASDNAIARALRAEEQIARAREVLKPFAARVSDYGSPRIGPDTPLWPAGWITVGHLRTAASMVAHLNEQEKDDG